MGHTGEACPHDRRPHLLAERRGDQERAAAAGLEDMAAEAERCVGLAGERHARLLTAVLLD
jgi:hypothetical protein